MGVLTGAARSYQHTATFCSVRHRGHRVAETHPLRSATALALRCSTLSGILRHPATDTWHVTMAATFCLLPRTCILGDVVSDLGAPQGTHTAFRFSHHHLKERSSPLTYSATCFRALPRGRPGRRDPQTAGEESWGDCCGARWPAGTLGESLPAAGRAARGEQTAFAFQQGLPASEALASSLPFCSVRRLAQSPVGFLDLHFRERKINSPSCVAGDPV